MNTKSRVLIVLVIVAALLALGAVYALAQTGGQINACVQRDGLLRFATDPSSCKKGEQAVYWNVMGDAALPDWRAGTWTATAWPTRRRTSLLTASWMFRTARARPERLVRPVRQARPERRERRVR